MQWLLLMYSIHRSVEFNFLYFWQHTILFVIMLITLGGPRWFWPFSVFQTFWHGKVQPHATCSSHQRKIYRLFSSNHFLCVHLNFQGTDVCKILGHGYKLYYLLTYTWKKKHVKLYLKLMMTHLLITKVIYLHCLNHLSKGLDFPTLHEL